MTSPTPGGLRSGRERKVRAYVGCTAEAAEAAVPGVFSEARLGGSHPRVPVNVIHAAPAPAALRNPRRVSLLPGPFVLSSVVKCTSLLGSLTGAARSPSPKSVTVPHARPASPVGSRVITVLRGYQDKAVGFELRRTPLPRRWVNRHLDFPSNHGYSTATCIVH